MTSSTCEQSGGPYRLLISSAVSAFLTAPPGPSLTAPPGGGGRVDPSEEGRMDTFEEYRLQLAMENSRHDAIRDTTVKTSLHGVTLGGV